MRLFLFGILLGIWCVTVAGQDLGSSNGLFGSDKKPTTATTKTRTPSSKEKKTKTVATSATKRQNPARVAAKVPVRLAPRKPEKPAELKTAKTFGPFDPETNQRYAALLAEGNASRRNSDDAAAESAFKRATALKPNDPVAFILLGNVYQDTMRWELAEKVFRWALALDPKNAAVELSLSRILAQPVAARNLAERYDEAEQLARRGLESTNGTAELQDQLGASLERQGFLGIETETAYRRAIAADPSFAPAYAHLGRLLGRKGKLDQAKAQYSAAVVRANDLASLLLVAASFQGERRYSESIPLLRKALAGAPRNYAALVILGRALMADGDLVGAEADLIIATRVSPFSFTAFSELGNLYIRQAKSEMAETVLLHGSKLADSFERCDLAAQFEELGDAFAKSGKLRSAENAYQSSKLMDPTRVTLASKIAGVKR